MKIYIAIIFAFIILNLKAQTETHEMPEIKIEGVVGGKPEPKDKPDPKEGSSGKGGGSGGSQSGKKASNLVPMEMAGQTFFVSPAARAEFNSLLVELRSTHTAGTIISGIGILNAIFDFLQNIPAALLSLDDPEEFVEETAKVLTLPKVFDEVLKQKMIHRLIDLENKAARQLKRGDELMWRQFIDIIRFPEKYEKQNLKVDLKTKSLSFITTKLDFSFKAESEIKYELSAYDMAELHTLIGFLMVTDNANIYMAYSDLNIKLFNRRKFTSADLTRYEMILLNRALLSLPKGYRNLEYQFFSKNMANPNLTSIFWETLRDYTIYESIDSQLTGSDADTLWILL